MLFVGVLQYLRRITCDNCCLSILLVVQKHRNDIDAQERKAKEAQFQKQQNEEIALKEKLNNLNDKDYIEEIARDDYYLSNKGEVIFRLPEDKDSSSSKSSKK